MSDPIDPRENPSKHKFDKLPDQVTSTDPVLLSPPQIPAGLKGFLGIPGDS